MTGLHVDAGAEEVSVSGIAPAIDGVYVVVPSIRVCLREATGYQIRKRRVELGDRLAETARGHLNRHITRFDAEAHLFVRLLYRRLVGSQQLRGALRASLPIS
jgi:hypothetical protein